MKFNIDTLLPKKNIVEKLTDIFGKGERVSLIQDANRLSKDITTPQNFFNYFEENYPQHPVAKLSPAQKTAVSEKITDMPRLLASEKGLDELNTILSDQFKEQNAQQGIERLQMLDFLEHLSDDHFKIPDKLTMQNLVEKFTDEQRIAFSKFSESNIVTDPSYEYDEELSPSINGLLKVAPTFRMTPEDIQDVKTSLKSVKKNDELRNLLLSAYLRESPLVSQEERDLTFIPTISVQSIADSFNALSRHGQILLENPTTIPTELLKNFPKVKEDDLALIVSYLNHFGYDVNQQSDILKKIEPQIGTKPISNLLLDQIKLDKLKNLDLNPARLGIDSYAEDDIISRKNKDVEILTDVTGINPAETIVQKLNKIHGYLNNFDVEISKLNSILRDKQSEALNDMLNLFLEETKGNKAEALEKMEDVIAKMHDGMYPNNASKKLKVLIQQIADVNTNLSYRVIDSLHKLTGVKIEKLPPFYMRQQWSQFRIRDEIAQKLKIKPSDPMKFQPMSPEDKILDQITDDFFSLLDIKEMSSQHDSHINISGGIPSETRQKFSDALRNAENERDQAKLRRVKVKEVSKAIDYEFENEKLTNEQRMKNVKSLLIDEFGVNELTNPILNKYINVKTTRSDIETAVKMLTNDVNKPFNHGDMKNILRKIILNDGYSGDPRKRFDKPSLGERVLFFKSGEAFKSAISRFSDYPTLADTLVRSTDAQIKAVARNKILYPYGQDFRRLFDSFRAVYGISSLDNSKLITNMAIGIINSDLEYIANNSPYYENFKRNKFFDKMDFLASLSSLGGLFVTVLSSDSIGYAIMSNNGIVDMLKGFLGYFKQITSHIDPKVLRAVYASTDHIFAPENPVHEDSFAKTGRILNRIFGIADLDRKGKHALTFSILSAFTNELEANEMGFMSNRLMEKGLTTEHFNFLKKNLDNYSHYENGIRVLSLRSFDDNPILQEVENVINRAVQSVIPSRALLSKSLRFKAGSTGIPVFNFVLVSMLRFSGVTTEHMYNLSIDQYLRNGFKGTMKSIYFRVALAESALYHFLIDLSKGQVPYWIDKDGNFDKGKMVAYFRTILLDSPNFGVFGGLIEASLGGNVSGLLGYRTLGSLNPLAKVAKATGEAATLHFGKAGNTLISAASSVNPIRNVPVIGNLFDRYITDSLRELVYEDAEKYLSALARYQSQAGKLSIIPMVPEKPKKEKKQKKEAENE